MTLPNYDVAADKTFIFVVILKPLNHANFGEMIFPQNKNNGLKYSEFSSCLPKDSYKDQHNPEDPKTGPKVYPTIPTFWPL